MADYVYILWDEYYYPETRVDHEALATDIIGIFYTEELAQHYLDNVYKERLLASCMEAEEWKGTVEDYLEEWGDPTEEHTYRISKRTMNVGNV